MYYDAFTLCLMDQNFLKGPFVDSFSPYFRLFYTVDMISDMIRSPDLWSLVLEATDPPTEPHHCPYL